MPINLVFQPRQYVPDIEGVRGGLKSTKPEDRPAIEALAERIKQLPVDQAKAEAAKHPGAVELRTAIENQQRLQRLQSIMQSGFTQAQPGFEAAGPPTRQGELPGLNGRGMPTQAGFDATRVTRGLLSEGLLTPQAQVQMNALQQQFGQGGRADAISNLGEYQLPDSGESVRAWFDKNSRNMFYRDNSGEMQPLPYNARKITPTSTGAERMKPNDLLKLRGEMRDIENGVKSITAYMNRVKDSPYGLQLLANKWIGKIKTIFGGNLSPEQLSVLEQNGRLQGLLGRFREEVVGGGVMTEQDALRVIYALGGEPDATRHPEVVRRLMEEIVGAKVKAYNDQYLPMYRDQRLKGGAYQNKLAPLSVPKLFTTPIKSTGDLSKKPIEEMTIEELDAEERRLKGVISGR